MQPKNSSIIPLFKNSSVSSHRDSNILPFFAGSAFNSDMSASKSAVFHESMANKIRSVNQWRIGGAFSSRAEIDDSIRKLGILVDPPEFHEPASRYKL